MDLFVILTAQVSTRTGFATATAASVVTVRKGWTRQEVFEGMLGRLGPLPVNATGSQWTVMFFSAEPNQGATS